MVRVGGTALPEAQAGGGGLSANFNLLRLVGIWEEAQEEVRAGAGRESFVYNAKELVFLIL